MGCFKLDILENLEPKLTVISKNSTSKKVRIVDFLTTKKGVEDYYPFGMLARNGQATDNNYRYGFQGQEEDNEVKGDGSDKRNGNSVNYKYRMHDPRLGRFFAIDPLSAKYPYNSPYAFSENRVIDGVELEGLEVESVHNNKGNLIGTISTSDNTAIQIQKYDKIEIQVVTINKDDPAYKKMLLDEQKKSAAIYLANIIKNSPSIGPGQYTKDAQLFEENLDLFVPVKLTKKIINGEEFSNVELGIEIAGILPLGKIFSIPAKGFAKIAIKLGGKSFDNLASVYKYAVKLPAGERVAMFKDAGEQFAKNNGLIPNKQLMKKNKGRTIYTDSNGLNYSLDTQHGAFEITTKKGKHLGEMKFDGNLNVDKVDYSGGHNLIVK